MKKTKIIIAGCLTVSMLLATFAFTRIHSPSATKHTTPVSPGFALVELFTSEGCSSCPSADRLAAKVQKQYADEPVYFLAFHVDYWNHLGWKDVFSDADYSKRQRNYAGYLKIDGVYTPQMVVNGKTEFVGSDEHALQTAIQKNLQKTTNEQLSISNVMLSTNKLSLQYKAGGDIHHSALLIAFVQKSGQTQVKAGENSGRTLAHINIVRKLQSIPFNGQDGGTARLDLPEGFNTSGWEVISFVQNTATGEILAAQKTSLPGNETAEMKRTEK